MRARQLPRDKRQGLPRQDRHRQTEKGGSGEAREIGGERETGGGKMRVPPTVPGVFRSLGHCPRGLLSRRRRRRSSLLLFDRSAVCSCSVRQGGEEGKEGGKGGGKEGGKSAGGRWRRQAPRGKGRGGGGRGRKRGDSGAKGGDAGCGEKGEEEHEGAGPSCAVS